MIINAVKPSTRPKAAPLPLCPQKITREKPWDRTRFLQATARQCYGMICKEQGRLVDAQLIKNFCRSRGFSVVLTETHQRTLIRASCIHPHPHDPAL